MAYKIFVTGSKGMLGHQVVAAFEGDNIPVTALCSVDYDFSDTSISSVFAESLAVDDVVINCAGLIRQRLPSQLRYSDIRRAFVLNSALPIILSESRAKLIHISTDCVFSGRASNYSEDDIPDPVDIYSRTKTLGESDNAMVLRQSIVGPELGLREKVGLFEWFASQSSAIGYTNHLWNGLTTKELARCLVQIVKNNLFQEGGIYHLFSDVVSKYELLELFNGVLPSPVKLSAGSGAERVDRTLFSKKSLVKTLNIRSLREQIGTML